MSIPFETFRGNVPNTEQEVTVVSDAGNGDITIQNFKNGKPCGEEIYYTSTDFDSAILDFEYRESVFVENTVQALFSVLYDHAEKFKECGGSYEAFANFLQEKLEAD